MPMSRRAFLGSVIGACAGPALARGGEPAREPHQAKFIPRKDERIEENLRRYGTPERGFGFLDRPAYAIDWECRPPSVPYDPQPGDFFFSNSDILYYQIGHILVGAGQPNHAGLIFRRPDGTWAALEAGPFDVPIIKTLDLETHLHAYDRRGRVWIRRRAVPLTAEQECHLAEVCLKQHNKRFATGRMWSQVTPFRARGPLRSYVVGKPHGTDGDAYMCSMLVTECCIEVGLIDPATARPGATYPSDLFYEHSRNPFLDRHFKKAPCWEPPARWRPHPLGEGCATVQ
jgi:hypothetical protein